MSNISRRQTRHGVMILVFLVTLLTTASAAVGADTTPPSRPSGLTATAIYSTQITLSWTASTDNVGVAGYNVTRGGVIVGTVSTTSFTDTGCSTKTRYKYRVQAFDAAGNVSAFSSAISVRTKTTASPVPTGTTTPPAPTDTTPPTAPTGLTASTASSSQISLSWSASSDNVGVAGYAIFRNSSQIATTGSLNYNDSGLSASTTYSYTVKAYDAAGNVSVASTSVSATTSAASASTGGTTSVAPPSIGAFYVAPTGNDSNPGTQSSPWRTIGKAVATLTTGQTAIVMDGTYEEGSLWSTHSGTASAPITIKAQNKWGAILSSTSGCNAAFMIGHSYITIQDLRISVSPSNVTCGIFTSSNAAVQAWSNTHNSPTSPAGEKGLVLRGLYVDDNIARRGAFKTGQDFSIIENNTVFTEIEGMNANGIIIRNNTITTGVISGLNDGGDGISVKGGARNAQIYNNIVRWTTDRTWALGAIQLGGFSCSACGWDGTYEAFNAVAYNNVVINDSGISNLGMFVMLSCKDCTVLNNVGLRGSLSLGIGGMAALQNANPTFKNNIFVSTGAATTGWTGAWSGTLTVEYNDFYSYSSGVPAQIYAIVGDPKFVDPASDWHLQAGSPALSTATPVPTTPAYGGGTLDTSKNRDGVTRTVLWNLGIY